MRHSITGVPGYIFLFLCLPGAALALTAALLVLPAQAGAQALEEIVVTARKREESLQDVPISVHAISGDFIENQGLVDFQALAPYTPNFSYGQSTGASDFLIIRGLGTVGSGVHFEQAVGQITNGFFTSRSRLGRTVLIDTAQVEVLRGPQGPIIGKNTSLGAINITTRKPTDEFEFIVSGGYDFEASEGYEIQGIVSGPFSDNFRGRLVVNYQDRDGFVENRIIGDDVQFREDLTTRIILQADLSDNFTAEFFWQHIDLDRNGKHREVFNCLEPALAMAQGFDCTINASNQSQNIVQGVDVGEPFTIDADLVGLTLDWEFGNSVLTSLTGYSQSEIFDHFDSDLKPLEGRNIFNNEDFDQFSQEIRLTSTGENTVDYIVGALYLTNEMNGTQDSNFNPSVGGPPPQPPVRRHEIQFADTDTLAGFAQIDWHLSDMMTLTIGGRLTNEERNGRKIQRMHVIHTDIFDPNLCSNEPTTTERPSSFRVCTTGNDGTQPVGSPILGNIDETNFSYNVSLQWSPTDDSMYYASTSTGFKSGGFDLRGAGDPANFIFDEEESTNYEIGGRHTLAGNTLRLNWTLYNTNIDGLQLSSNDPATITQTVVNGEATATGLEWDLVWAASDNLNLRLAGAYLDATYDNFLAACYTLPRQTAALGCNVDLDGTPGEDPEEAQNLAGQTLAFAPEWQAVAGADYTWNLASGRDLRASLTLIYSDEQSTMIDNNPAGFQDAYTKIDASLTLLGEDGKWWVALIGKNLTDELVYHFTSGTTTCARGAAPGGTTSCLFTTVEETRAIGIRAQYSFR